jgi:anti-sigma regulatory factor (Ser/Thr protein kinase)
MDGGMPAPDFSALPVVMPDRPAEGGFGWPLIHALTDQVRQSRRRGWNILTLHLRGGPCPAWDADQSTRWHNHHEDSATG